MTQETKNDLIPTKLHSWRRRCRCSGDGTISLASEWRCGIENLAPVSGRHPDRRRFQGPPVPALALIATIYGVWRPRDVAPILTATLRESTMLMMIIGMSLLFSYVMSFLHLSQSTAEWVVGLHLSKWVLLAAILLMFLAVLLICIFPGIATGLPDGVMGMASVR
ncbi:MAG: TRAP transporter large permease subunit [Rhodoferax sp.]|nr:TRAP transporter large permease subunit [Rhodoferax sp.]